MVPWYSRDVPPLLPGLASCALVRSFSRRRKLNEIQDYH